MGLAELESLFGADRIRPLENAALLAVPAEEINFKKLGGTIKVARLLAELPHTDFSKSIEHLAANIPHHLQHLPPGKFTMGLSVYGLKVSSPEINRATLGLKKTIKQTGRSVRIVPNKQPVLNSAQVLHNKLTHKGGWELLLMKNGAKTLLAQTLFVQDIDEYAARDQVRPKRDPRVGMLPPKLAQIIINLAIGNIGNREKIRVLDPFCGTGVILQEALLMGYNVIGTDIETRLVAYSKQNIGWLFQKYPHLQGHVVIEPADATNHRWPRFSTVASEIYLGRALSSLPSDDKLKQIVSDVNTIAKKFLANLSPQLKTDQRICLAVPAWRRPNGKLIHLPLIDRLTDMGYNELTFKHVNSDELIYYRENQIVARQLLVLKRSSL